MKVSSKLTPEGTLYATFCVNFFVLLLQHIVVSLHVAVCLRATVAYSAGLDWLFN
jgi:hypothetical protein